jgi:hypothetical protein
MTIFHPGARPSNVRRVVFLLIATCLTAVNNSAADESPATLFGEQASFNGYKYGFEGFQTPTHKYLQQVSTVTSTGTKTSTTTVDPKTGVRSTSTSGSATDYGGTWNVQSDTFKQRSGGSGSNTSQGSATLSNEYTTEQLKSNVEGWVPAFEGNFVEDVDTALISLSPAELSYTIKKLQYKWQFPSDPRGAVFWDVVFEPADNSEAGHDQHGWATHGQTESEVYAVDPTALNDKKAGVYTVKLSNNDVIQVDAFIPQEWVFIGIDNSIVHLGNSRKDPLDNSLNTGTTIYERDGDFKLRHRQSLTTLAQADPGGTIEAGTVDVQAGLSAEYDADDLVDGHIPFGAQPIAVGYNVPSIGPVTITHPSEGVVTITLEDTASNSLILGSGLFPIHFRATITIDKSVPGQHTYHVTGQHCRFPAYEVYINGNRVHQYSPIPTGVSPVLGIMQYDRTFDNSGGL